MTSGATISPVFSLSMTHYTSAELTPVRAADDRAVTNLSSGNSEIG